LAFAEGPAAEAMAVLDRAVVRRMRAADELGLTAPAEIETELEAAPPVAALFALPLRLAGEYQGALYLGYRQPHYFGSDERNLLRTLAGQASVLVQNAYLFAAAEGGRRRLAAVLASTPNAVLVTDQTDRVLLVNPALERAFNLRAADVVGRPILDALAAGAAGPHLARWLTTGPTGAERKLELTADNRDFLAAVSTVHTSDGQAIGRVAVLQDVTDLKEVDRLKSEFLDGISHDLRSPLTYMRTYAGLLPLPDDPAREQEYVNKIVAGIDRMSVLVEGLLEMANLRAGTGVQFDRVEVGELLREVAQEYASPAWMRGVRLVAEAAGNLPPVKADPTLLRRALTNLLTNALKYAPESGPVVLRAEAQGDEVVLSVRDRGPGIAAAELPYVFQKFYRGGQGLAGRPPGSGLGLAIVKSIADLHDGRVWAESTPGEGSTFYLALPVVRR
jgi:PAS domain S-box-containing protein